MAWPQPIDYSAAIQKPAENFLDPELMGGKPAMKMLMGMPGLPLAWSGNFAAVFKVLIPASTGADGTPRTESWAVKCFTREVRGLQQRYARISDHLEKNPRKFAVKFQYLEPGIRVKQEWYPALKMHWVEGTTLNEFLREHCTSATVLEQLSVLWQRLAVELRDSRMAHGDLQHGNVLLVPGGKSGGLVLRLIDYDGMWVPELASTPSAELGHGNYQHPLRKRTSAWNADIDRFSHLVICTALRALAAGGKTLWNRHDNDENLLFREADFLDPARSKLFPELLSLPEPGAVALAGHLADACQQPMNRVPLLTEVLDGSRVVPLSAEQLDRLGALFPGVTLPKPPQTVMRPSPQPVATPSRPASHAEIPATQRAGTPGPARPAPTWASSPPPVRQPEPIPLPSAPLQAAPVQPIPFPVVLDPIVFGRSASSQGIPVPPPPPASQHTPPPVRNPAVLSTLPEVLPVDASRGGFRPVPPPPPPPAWAEQVPWQIWLLGGTLLGLALLLSGFGLLFVFRVIR